MDWEKTPVMFICRNVWDKAKIWYLEDCGEGFVSIQKKSLGFF